MSFYNERILTVRWDIIDRRKARALNEKQCGIFTLTTRKISQITHCCTIFAHNMIFVDA